MGEFVEIITDVSISLKNEMEHGVSEKSQPMIVSGFFVDFDENFLYLGTKDGKIVDGVGIKHIVQVGKSEPQDEYDKMLDEVEEPEADGYN